MKEETKLSQKIHDPNAQEDVQAYPKKNQVQRGIIVFRGRSGKINTETLKEFG